MWAHHVACIVNVGSFCYFRCQRLGSLWTSPETGEHSPLRHRQNAQIIARATRNAERVAAGRPPDLTPLERAAPVALEHVTGPRLSIG